MLKAIKVRIYPNKEQSNFINRQLGCCRFVYNNCLEYKKISYEKEGITISPSETIKYVTKLKTDEDKEWLKEVHSKVLQQTIIDLNVAYKNFFKNGFGFPKFKCKHDNNQSCRFPKDAFIGIRGNRIDIVRALSDVHFKCSRKDEIYLNKNQDKVKSITLRREPCGFCYLSILIDKPNNQINSSTNVIGIDLGVKDFVITSNGEVFENHHFKKSFSNRLKHLQRELSRKQKDSKNRNKARKKLAKLNKRINDKKLNYLHEVSNALINENQVICMEDLNVKGMVKNHNLAESISEMNFGEFRRMLEYKAEWYERIIVKVDRFYPSSKTCNHCGYIKKDLKLSDRTWICPDCGAVINRDFNAACNIKDEGLKIYNKQIGLSSPEFTLVNYPTMDDRLRNKELKSSDRLKQEKNEFH